MLQRSSRFVPTLCQSKNARYINYLLELHCNKAERLTAPIARFETNAEQSLCNAQVRSNGCRKFIRA
jgi:hypothetical protein